MWSVALSVMANRILNQMLAQTRPTFKVLPNLGVLRLIYAFRFSGHLRAKLDPLQRPRHHSTPPFTLEEFGLNESDLDKTFDMGSYQGPNCNTLKRTISTRSTKPTAAALALSICTFQT